ncbi:MAG: tetratricopeptide repeat protein [Candidatus Kapaibacterium sp.]|nr:MAG: tetratricopeptide repeat protein [Candidatus Kapabacteria bacterium]
MAKKSAPKNPVNTKNPFAANTRLQAIVIAAFAFLLYAHTISFDYAADDGMVILGHSIVKKGFAGIPELLTSDSFRGLDEAEGRTETRRTYRPLSFISFAIEYQFFQKNPAVSHTLNVLCYALLGAIVLFLLRRLLLTHIDSSRKHNFTWNILPFVVSCLFVAHPIHTEVVANIKSRDEIFALLFLLLSLLSALKYYDTNDLKQLCFSSLSFMLALLSKESAVTFLPVFPLALWWYGHRWNEHSTQKTLDWKRLALVCAPLVILALGYLAIWFGIIGRVEDKLYYDTLNNPFANATFAGRTATATGIMGLYFLKSLFPVTLSTGYTYNEIPLVDWSNFTALGAAVIILLLLVGGAYLLVVRKNIVGLCALAWCSTLAIASNYFVYAGGLLGERFLFTPSLFAMLALGVGAALAQERLPKERRVWVMLALVAFGGIYSVKTFARATDWKSTETLLRADVENTPNSIHLRRMYGGLLLQKSGTATQGVPSQDRASQFDARKNIRAAEEQFRAGLRINPTIAPSLVNGIGNIFAAERRYDSAIAYFRAALRLNPNNTVYQKNLANALSVQSRIFFSQNSPEASNNALLLMYESAQILPTDSTLSNLGAMFAQQNRIDSAIVYLEKALALNPNLARARSNLAVCLKKRDAATSR